jgi:thiol-disulfide isomerase/thioredoxin
MKKISTLFLVAMFCCWGKFGNCQSITTVTINDIKKIIDTSTMPTVINFWATWCKPCQEEIVWFNNNKDNLDRKNIRVFFISLDFENNYSFVLQSFTKAFDISLPIYWLNESNSAVLQQIEKDFNGVIPATLLINNSKKYRQFYSGALKPKKMVAQLEKLL